MDIEITLTTHTYGGAAMGRLPDPVTGADGRAVFVPFGLPGERVRARITEEKAGFVRAELIEVLTASPQRIPPRCRHFGVCGGCHYQHMPYAAQLAAKADVLRDQLERIGKIRNPPVQATRPSLLEWNYRNHIQFHLTGDARLAFVDARAASLVAISECHLPEEPINSFWPQLSFEAPTTLERISLRAGGGELMVILESDDPRPPELEIETDVSVVHLSGEDVVVLAGEDHIPVDIVVEIQNSAGGEVGPTLRKTFRVSAGSFFQVNTPMAGMMVAHLLERLPLTPQTSLADVYCGVGLFSAFLAPRVAQLIGIESSPAACDDFSVNLDEFNNVTLYEAQAEEALSKLDARPDVIVVDPPRAGLDRRVVDAIQAIQPDILAYVSCDPSTLARDAARLIQGGYELSEVTPFDLFPQTYHIESISIFRR